MNRPKQQLQASTTSYMAFCLLLSAIFLVVLALWIGLAPVGSSSEGREGQVVRSMLRSGEYLLPLRNGIVPSKPPLYHWISAIISTLRGSSDEWSIRAPSALAASGILLMTLLLACRLYASFLSPALLTFIGVVLATSYGFIAMAGDARVDTVFSFFTTLAIFAIVSKFDSKNPLWHRQANFSLFFFALGLAVLAKGPLGAVLPSVIVASILWNAAGLKQTILYLIRPRIGWLYLILLVAPFYIIAPLSAADGVKDEFVWRHIIYENLERFLGGEDIPRKAWWFYIPTFLRSAAPWSLLFIWLTLKRNKIEHTELRLPLNLTMLWFLSGFILFSLAAGKRHSYLLPLYPGMALALGAFFIERREWFSNYAKRFLLSKESALGIAAALILLTLELVRTSVFATDPIIDFARGWIKTDALWRAEISLVVALALAGLIRYRVRLSKGSQLLMLWGAILLIICPILFVRTVVKNSLFEFNSAALRINALVPANTELIVVKYKREEHFDPIFYYIDREVKLHDAKELSLPINSTVLARHSWLESWRARNPNIQFTELYRSNKVSDQAVGDKEREIVLFQTNT